jgi:hypothetical protein
VLPQVLPDAERAAGAGQHDRPDGVVVADRLDGRSSAVFISTTRLFSASGR